MGGLEVGPTVLNAKLLTQKGCRIVQSIPITHTASRCSSSALTKAQWSMLQVLRQLCTTIQLPIAAILSMVSVSCEAVESGSKSEWTGGSLTGPNLLNCHYLRRRHGELRASSAGLSRVFRLSALT